MFLLMDRPASLSEFHDRMTRQRLNARKKQRLYNPKVNPHANEDCILYSFNPTL